MEIYDIYGDIQLQGTVEIYDSTFERNTASGVSSYKLFSEIS
jgi:hypothetical protein